ncbi:MAG: hypothetical protein Q9M10_03420 [Mariprofundaceae bacterium]|nr:hypothetical protein [Mariprofundaceae bacterium]
MKTLLERKLNALETRLEAKLEATLDAVLKAKTEPPQVLESRDYGKDIVALKKHLHALETSVIALTSVVEKQAEIKDAIEIPAPPQATPPSTPMSLQTSRSETLHLFDAKALDETFSQGNYVLSHGVDSLGDTPMLVKVDDFSKAHEKRVVQHAYNPLRHTMHVRAWFEARWSTWKEMTNASSKH